MLLDGVYEAGVPDLAKIDVLHAAIIETAKRAHPYEGHKLSLSRWNEVLTDPMFMQDCNSKFGGGRRRLFGGAQKPSSTDYSDLRDTYGPMLPRWQLWPGVKVFFYCLDADRELMLSGRDPFFNEIAEDAVYEDLADQVERGFVVL